MLVTISEGELIGRYVLEAKDTRLTLRSTWRALDAAMANRGASAAVAVFASGELAPATLPFFYTGERAIVVLDRERPDPAALQLACLWARWVVRRSATLATTNPDPERMTSAIERAQRALTRLSAIRRSHSTATKALDTARGQVEELATEVRTALADLAAELVT